MVACMYATPINQGCYVIQEGTGGAQAYVLEGKSFFTSNCEHLSHWRILINISLR